MERKPKIGDTVYCVPRNGKPYDTTIMHVDSKRFYTAGNGESFEIDSFVGGAWYSMMTNTAAYISKEVYEKQKFKQIRINQICNPDSLLNLSCAKVNAIYDLIVDMPNMKSAEEWET